jgi:hypothetical protein
MFIAASFPVREGPAAERRKNVAQGASPARALGYMSPLGGWGWSAA